MLVWYSCPQIFDLVTSSLFFFHLHHFTAALYVSLTPLAAAFIPLFPVSVLSSTIQQDLLTERAACWTSEPPLNTYWPGPHSNHTFIHKARANHRCTYTHIEFQWCESLLWSVVSNLWPLHADRSSFSCWLLSHCQRALWANQKHIKHLEESVWFDLC